MKETIRNHLFEDLKTLYIIMSNKGIKNDTIELYSEKINNVYKIFGTEYSNIKYESIEIDMPTSIENILDSIDNMRIRKNLFEDDCEIFDYVLDDLIYLLRTKF